MTKINQNSFQVCFEWRNDWGGLKGTIEPRPSQIIRALASQGWSGHRRTPRCITNLELYAGAGSFQLSRPRKVKIHDQGMSMVNEPGISSYQPMANLERATASSRPGWEARRLSGSDEQSLIHSSDP